MKGPAIARVLRAQARRVAPTRALAPRVLLRPSATEPIAEKRSPAANAPLETQVMTRRIGTVTLLRRRLPAPQLDAA